MLTLKTKDRCWWVFHPEKKGNLLTKTDFFTGEWGKISAQNYKTRKDLIETEFDLLIVS